MENAEELIVSIMEDLNNLPEDWKHLGVLRKHALVQLWISRTRKLLEQELQEVKRELELTKEDLRNAEAYIE